MPTKIAKRAAKPTGKPKRPRPGPKKLPVIRTERPADESPAVAYRYGATVIVRLIGPGPAVLTPAEARKLADLLRREAKKADATPWACVDTHPQGSRQLPDE